MSVQIRIAETKEEREQAYRLRYDIYVGELALPMEYADHDRGQVIDPLDEHGELIVAIEDGQVVGTMRVNVADQPGGLGEYEQLYEIERFGQHYPSAVSITTRNCVLQSRRKTTIPAQLARHAFQHLLNRGVRFDVIDCQPHLVSFHERLGHRVIGPTISHPDDPTVQHTVMAIAMRDVEHLKRVRSPFRKLVPPGWEDGSSGAFLSSFRTQAQCA